MNSIKHYLHGDWSFSFTHPTTKKVYNDKATIPGNVEPELVRMGLLGNYLPSDRRDATMDFDMVDDWTYVKLFDAPELKAGYERELVFDGIDTVAEIYLNGEKLADCVNMHRVWRFPVGERLKPTGNELKVVIHSAELWARERMPDIFPMLLNSSTEHGSYIYLRKARHSWGWDNAPRLVTSGIFRPVYLEDLPSQRFDNVYFYTSFVDEKEGVARLAVHWFYHLPREVSCKGYRLRLTLSFEGKELYSSSEELFSCNGVRRFTVPLDQIKLWWPYGMGEPNLCDLRLEMYKDDELRATYDAKWGVRTVKLYQSEALDSNGKGEFIFLVNNYKVMVRGANWKPTDPLHSRADEKVLAQLELVKALHCNMVRIWGGGIYEDHAFFDFCDRNGILVWQDFMFACEVTPRDSWYCEEVRAEAAEIVRKLRNHPSLAVWCGDNEVDMFFRAYYKGSAVLPSDQIISREILKDCVLRNDPFRDFVESSPKIPDQTVYQDLREFFLKPAEEHDGVVLEDLEVTYDRLENHIYPVEDGAGALRRSTVRFIGETGPATYNPMTDDEEIWEREKARAIRLWDEDFKTTKLPPSDMHQSDHYFVRWISCGRREARRFFGRDFTVEEWKSYCEAINVICAYYYKDGVEYTRVSRWTKTGILWWSLADMWPMLFNYSLVDANLKPKLPFYWVRQSQRPFALMAVRREVGGVATLYATNDTLKRQSGDYRITAYDTDGNASVFATGSYDVAPNKVAELSEIAEDGKQQLLIIEWTEDEKTHFNHFVTGEAPYPFATWECWNEILNRHFEEDAQ